MALLRGAFGAERGAAVLREFFGKALLGRVAHQMRGPDAELRASLAVSQLIGVAVLRYVVRFPSLASAPLDQLIDTLAPRIRPTSPTDDHDEGPGRRPSPSPVLERFQAEIACPSTA